MTALFSLLLAVHIGAGFVAVLVGLGPILTTKGSRLHRLSGRLFVGVMLILLAAAWVMTVMRFSPYLLALSATATYHVFSGTRVLGRKHPERRAEDRARAIDWMAAFGVVAVGLMNNDWFKPKMPKSVLPSIKAILVLVIQFPLRCWLVPYRQ